MQTNANVALLHRKNTKIPDFSEISDEGKRRLKIREKWGDNLPANGLKMYQISPQKQEMKTPEFW